MRNKRFLSTVVASALVATTMAMPVMAAGESGSVNVDVTTKTGVLRVAVPTSMAMEIDQFEITQTGAQIASGEFEMVNHSEMPVKVDVTSTATLGTSVKLVATKKAAADSKTEGEAWLAVAAQTADGSYDDLKTGTTDKPVAENYWDLAESNANVTTFDATSKDAKQSFYLAKAAEKVSDEADAADAEKVYTFAVPTEAGKYKESYVQFYALTTAPGTTDDDDDTNSTEQDKLEEALAAGDVYVVAKGTGDDGPVDAADGATMTKLEKGSSATWANTNEYYTAAATATEAKDIVGNNKYMYVAMNTAGGKAGFTYVGKLSDANEKTWTSQNDIKKIAIAYTIKGITASSYEAVEDDCTYGLYTPVTGPQVTITPGGVITITGLTAETDPTDMNLIDVEDNNKAYNLTSQTSTWTATGSAASGTIIVKLGQDWFGLANKEVKIELDLKDGSKISNTTTLGTAPSED